MKVSFEIHDHEVDRELSRLSRGPGASTTVFKLESILMRYFAATQGIVHIKTGKLKSTGHTSSSFDGGTWTGTASYARHPGIFELARGNSASGAWATPPGTHYFFEPMYDSPHAYQEAVLGFLDGD